MKIDNKYEGSSIDIIEINDINNLAKLSPKKENNQYSNYYNFVVTNDKNKEGKVYIRNLNHLLVSNNKNNIQLPKYKNQKNEYEEIEKNRINIVNDELIINIKEKETLEISSYPKYTMDDLMKFINNKKEKIVFKNEIIPEIIIGNPNGKTIMIIARQHPGETLSSYFIEGIITGIIDNLDKIEETKFIIFPIVNQKGVKNGNHRYTEGHDYNRLWDKEGIIKEIDYIKKVATENNITMFIDVHCDELTEKDYMRTNKYNHDKTVAGMIVIKNYSKLTRFLRALIKQKKIISLANKSAREFMTKKYKCESILIELTLKNTEREKRYKQGYDFIKEIIEK